MAGILRSLLSATSGSNTMKISEQLLFDKVIGFKGLRGGVGTSTIVANLAIALSEKTSYNIGILDTSFLANGQYPLLFSKDDLLLINKKVKKDLLDFNGDIGEISASTQYKNVYVVALNDRTIVDMMSTMDSASMTQNVINSMKSYFDIILIDLSDEKTQIETYSAIKCNKIYYVAEPSIRCTYNLKKTINTMATLAIPTSKASKVIINKEITSMHTGLDNVLEDAGLEILGAIPLSLEIAKLGVSGKRIWGRPSRNADISMFHSVLTSIIDDIVEETPLNAHYLSAGMSNDTSQLGDDSQDVSVILEDTLTEIIEDDDMVSEYVDYDEDGSIEL